MFRILPYLVRLLNILRNKATVQFLVCALTIRYRIRINKYCRFNAIQCFDHFNILSEKCTLKMKNFVVSQRACTVYFDTCGTCQSLPLTKGLSLSSRITYDPRDVKLLNIPEICSQYVRIQKERRENERINARIFHEQCIETR